MAVLKTVFINIGKNHRKVFHWLFNHCVPARLHDAAHDV